jgi:hypothetical protein
MGGLAVKNFDIGRLAWWVYWVGDAVTFVYLTFFDGTDYNWWNWLVIVPANFILASLWPIYWLLLRPFFS